MFMFVVATVFVLCVMEYMFFHSPKYKVYNNIPSERRIPIIGHSLDFVLDPVKTFYRLRQLNNKFKKCFCIHFGFCKIINISTPEDVEIILSSTKNNMIKGREYKFLQDWLKEGLLLSKGEKWHQRRKILTPAFHFNILKEFCNTFVEQTKSFLQSLKLKEDKVVDVTTLITELTINTICETAMGTQCNIDKTLFERYKAGIHDMSDIVRHRSARIWLYLDLIYMMTPMYWKQCNILSQLHNFTTSVIRKRREERKQLGESQISTQQLENDNYITSTKKRLAMLDLLLEAEAEGKIDEAGIREEVDTFMFEGHDTTTSGVTFCLMSIANDKRVQDKINEELNEIFMDSERAPTMQDYSNMKYLELCIKESLRLHPPVPLISRHIDEDIKLSNFFVPAGSNCFIHILDLHRNSAVFLNPDAFIPERFTLENSTTRHPFSNVPFSAGPRNCIGQKFAMLEMKSIISTILRNFILEPITKQEDLTFFTSLILKSNNPVYIKFIPRH